MQALKALVIVMGVLIIAGLAVIVVTIYNRMQARTASAGAAADGELPAFDRAAVPVPAGCRVAAMQPAGDRLLLQLAGIAGCEQILVVDLRSGRLLGRLDLVAAP